MKLPVLFMGHGSPMNIIEDNTWTKNWSYIGQNLNNIKGIVMISAHWFTRATLVTEERYPETIYDMFGFPKALYEKTYDAENKKELRDRVLELVDEAELNSDWGYDHGNYTLLFHMYPFQNIPVVQLSINGEESLDYHYQLGKKLRPLREENILIIGSGNIVHNLGQMREGRDYGWAKSFERKLVKSVRRRDLDEILKIEGDENYPLAVPFTDHFYPFVVALGASEEEDDIKVINRDQVGGSLYMTSFMWGFDNFIFEIEDDSLI